MVLGVMLSSPAPLRAETVLLVTNEWCPYNCKPNSEKPGYMIEIAQRAFAMSRIHVRYITLPWSEAVKEVRQGKYHGLVGATKEEAKGFVFTPEHMGISVDRFYVRSDSVWRFLGMDSLRYASLGIIQGYNYGDELDDYIMRHVSNINRIQVARGSKAVKKNLNKLLLGRISTMIEDQYVMEYMLMEENAVEKVKEAGSLGNFVDPQKDLVYIAFSPKHRDGPRYASILARGVRELRASGELHNILAKYGLETWPTKLRHKRKLYHSNYSRLQQAREANNQILLPTALPSD
jgi:polar amino acid transport system substrate-binding protein